MKACELQYGQTCTIRERVYTRVASSQSGFISLVIGSDKTSEFLVHPNLVVDLVADAATGVTGDPAQQAAEVLWKAIVDVRNIISNTVSGDLGKFYDSVGKLLVAKIKEDTTGEVLDNRGAFEDSFCSMMAANTLMVDNCTEDIDYNEDFFRMILSDHYNSKTHTDGSFVTVKIAKDYIAVMPDEQWENRYEQNAPTRSECWKLFDRLIARFGEKKKLSDLLRGDFSKSE